VSDRSLQEIHAPTTTCFGCGPANHQGLRIRTFIEGDIGVCRFQAEKHHESFPGAISGGIIGSLFDCHCNWTAAHHLMQANGLDHPPCTVTAEYTVSFKAPTPSADPVEIRARVEDASLRRATVTAEMLAGDTVTATCRAVFVSVKEGHPAYHRW
jgi:acyl-coenzyme A thioesterase PaaI-like protein